MDSYKKIVAVFMAVCFALCSISCGAPKDDIVMKYKEKTVTSSYYRFVFSKLKYYTLNYYQSYDSYYTQMGYTDPLGLGVAVSDTTDFWNSKFPGDTSGKTIGESVKEMTNSYIKDALVIDEVGKKYNFSGISDSNASTIESQHQTYIDAVGSNAMWNIKLASYGITDDDWMRYSVTQFLPTDLKEFLYGKDGPLEVKEEEAMKKLDEESLRIKTYVKLYSYAELSTSGTTETTGTGTTGTATTGTATTGTATTSASATTNATTETTTSATGITTSTATATSGTGTETETTTATTVDPVIKKKVYDEVKAVYDSIKKGDSEFDKEREKSDDYSYMNSYYPDGIVVNRSSLEKDFGADGSKLKTGDLIMSEVETGVYIVSVIDFTEDDVSEELDDIISDKFTELLKEYTVNVEVFEDVIDAISFFDIKEIKLVTVSTTAVTE